MFAAKLIADDTFNVLMIVAAVMAVLERAFVVGLIAAGLAFAALAWVVVS